MTTQNEQAETLTPPPAQAETPADPPQATPEQAPPEPPQQNLAAALTDTRTKQVLRLKRHLTAAKALLAVLEGGEEDVDALSAKAAEIQEKLTGEDVALVYDIRLLTQGKVISKISGENIMHGITSSYGLPEAPDTFDSVLYLEVTRKLKGAIQNHFQTFVKFEREDQVFSPLLPE